MVDQLNFHNEENTNNNQQNRLDGQMEQSSEQLFQSLENSPLQPQQLVVLLNGLNTLNDKGKGTYQSKMTTYFDPITNSMNLKMEVLNPLLFNDAKQIIEAFCSKF